MSIMGILERLRHRIDVYAKTESKTEFGEPTYSYENIGTVWGEIVVKSGKSESEEGESERANATHRITVRNGAIKNPRNDMYFMYRGQKYEILYYMPYYKNNDLIDFYCRLILETEGDYGDE